MLHRVNQQVLLQERSHLGARRRVEQPVAGLSQGVLINGDHLRRGQLKAFGKNIGIAGRREERYTSNCLSGYPNLRCKQISL